MSFRTSQERLGWRSEEELFMGVVAFTAIPSDSPMLYVERETAFSVAIISPLEARTLARGSMTRFAFMAMTTSTVAMHANDLHEFEKVEMAAQKTRERS
jgi:hypothetical protein